jgi:hypothetical protein
MRTKPPKGLMTLRDACAVIPKWAGAENDPVVLLRCSYRMGWNAITRNESLAERVGGRLFIRDSKLPDLAAALGVTPAQPRKARPAHKPAGRAVPHHEAAVAA